MSTQQQLPPPAQMMQMITGFWTSCCIYAVAKLGVADQLAHEPLTSAELAARTQTHAPSLYRVMRALSGVGIFSESPDGKFSLTALGETLRSNVPGSMRAMAIAQLGDHFGAWGNLLYSVRTGEIAFDHVHGMPIWKYYEAHPEEGLNFVKAMAGLTGAVIANVIPVYDWSKFETIVDVGGGNGALLFAILGAAQQAKGIVFDEPYVVDETRRHVAEKNLSERCSTQGGSFFESIPAGADCYIMKMILHDWDDDKSLTILTNCAKAMKPGSKLLILESVLPEGNVPHPGKFMDINMLCMTGGCERTEAEFKTLLNKSGLQLTSVIPTHSPMFSIVEATK